METSKIRQIPTTNACPNFSFRGLRKKFPYAFSWRITWRTSVTLINYIYALVSSGNPVRTHGRVYHGRSRPGLRPSRAAPGIMQSQMLNYATINRKLLPFTLQACLFTAPRAHPRYSPPMTSCSTSIHVLPTTDSVIKWITYRTATYIRLTQLSVICGAPLTTLLVTYLLDPALSSDHTRNDRGLLSSHAAAFAASITPRKKRPIWLTSSQRAVAISDYTINAKFQNCSVLTFNILMAPRLTKNSQNYSVELANLIEI